MDSPDRRSILRAVGASAAATAFPETISKALAMGANSVTGTYKDVKHIVVLMQENRSFDHYFGTLHGVRGFNDPRAVTLPSGNPVFYQPNNGTPPYFLPFHPTAPFLGYQFLGDLAHNWSDAHNAWNNGNNDGWIAAKGKETMAYMTRADLPFHYALADAFTICDNYHCSIMAATDPNRFYLWTGWVGQNGTNPDSPAVGSTPGSFTLNASGSSQGNGALPFGPVVNNDEQGYSWMTYPERLTNANISWKVYQDVGLGLNGGTADYGFTSNPYIGNFGDTSLLWFKQYQNAVPGSALYQAARTGTNIFNGGGYNGGTFNGQSGSPLGFFTNLQNDVLNNSLPQVSWIVAPQAYCEHPAYPANWGAWYVQNVLAALTANQAVWGSTVFIIDFDENDGFFDHLVAPTPPQNTAQGMSTVSTVNELYPGIASSSFQAHPYGLGARVPMLIVSPWSKGGWVCSQTFDHTSVIQFIETCFGVVEPQITPWRRTVCGDLTSAFDFTISNALASHLPSTANYLEYPTSTAATATLAGLTQAQIAAGKQPVSTFTAAPPVTNQIVPVQETGLRLARPLPYQSQAGGSADPVNQQFGITFANAGTAGEWFHVRSAPGVAATNSGGGSGPWGYTVEPGKALFDIWTPAPSAAGTYNLSVYGTNGFFRNFQGGLGSSSVILQVDTAYGTDGSITLTITNTGTVPTAVSILDRYAGHTTHTVIGVGLSYTNAWSLQASYSWYDLTITASADTSFSCQCAGHVETGANSVSDPLL